MGFDPEEKTYKVLMTLNGFTKPTRNWVFTLGIDESWREITNFTLPINKKNPVCVYMMSYIEDKLFVMVFEVKSENCRLWNST